MLKSQARASGLLMSTVRVERKTESNPRPGGEHRRGRVGHSRGVPSDVRFLESSVGGRIAYTTEYNALLAAAGIDLVGVTPTATPFSIIEGRPR